MQLNVCQRSTEKVFILFWELNVCMPENDMNRAHYHTFESFLEDLGANPEKIFHNDERKWLKIYLMIADDNWQTLFLKFNPIKLGQIYYLKMPFGDEGNSVDYYIHEIEKGLLMFFTPSKREEYNQTLLQFVKQCLGVTQMWLPPSIFDEILNYIISTYQAKIYSFTARRPWSSKFPAKIRADFSRLIHYSGDDAGYALKELKDFYGVLPTIVDFKIGSDKIRVSNDGLFFLKGIDKRMLRMVDEVVDRVIAEQRRLRNVSKQVSYTKESVQYENNIIEISSLMSGKVVFNTKLNPVLLEQLFKSFKDEEFGRSEEGLSVQDFSFIGANIRENSMSYSATVYDEDKGTIFGISGNQDTMILIPKHNTTFESFINFYRMLNENIDNSSNLYLFSENIVK
jgi:hypothetical protein